MQQDEPNIAAKKAADMLVVEVHTPAEEPATPPRHRPPADDDAYSVGPSDRFRTPAVAGDPNSEELVPTAQSSDSPWHVRLMPDALDRLREHPMFALHPAAAGDEGVIMAHTVAEADREPTYRMELLRMFRERIQLVTGLGLVIVPLFAVLHAVFADDIAARNHLLTAQALLLVLCLTLRMLARRVDNLLWARMLALIGYTLFSMGAAVQVTQVADMEGNQFLIYGAYHQMLLSVLLLPLTVWESLVIGSIIIGSLAWASWMTSAPEHLSFYTWHLVVLCMTALFMLCVAYFQTLLRRQAFHAAFDLARSAAQLQTLTVLDVLTGGYNRRHLEQVLGVEVARAARFGRPLSVIMFDLDAFKRVNDTRGHAAGDEVLRRVWAAASATVREVDTVARFGGDEFAIVLPEADQDAAGVIAERLHDATAAGLQERFGRQSVEGRVSISVGVITLFPAEPIPVGTILHWADEQLYEAKRSGKNCTISRILETAPSRGRI